jgi:hypothetical protein
MPDFGPLELVIFEIMEAVVVSLEQPHRRRSKRQDESRRAARTKPLEAGR